MVTRKILCIKYVLICLILTLTYPEIVDAQSNQQAISRGSRDSNQTGSLSGISAFQPTPKSQTVSIKLPVTQRWTSTGIKVERDDLISIVATGTMYYDAQHPSNTSTPDGYNCPVAINAMPGLRCLSLIGKIGWHRPFNVGSAFTTRANTSGTLYLGVNDSYYPDNHPDWDVTIRITHTDFNCDDPQVGDIIMYWKNGNIVHSGIVSEVKNCVVKKIDCYYLPTKKELKNVDPSSVIFSGYGEWTVYSNRSHDPKIDIFNWSQNHVPYGCPDGKSCPEGLTDKQRIIAFAYDDINCHGYTFNAHYLVLNQNTNKATQRICGILGIVEKNNSNQYNWLIHQANVEQGVAAEAILLDNGYVQIHVKGPDNEDHFNTDYEVDKFKLPPPAPPD